MPFLAKEDGYENIQEPEEAESIDASRASLLINPSVVTPTHSELLATAKHPGRFSLPVPDDSKRPLPPVD